MIQSSMKLNRSSRDSSAGRRRRSNLAVGFQRRTWVYLVDSHYDYSDAEHDQVYQTEMDECRNRKDVVRCITVLRSGSEEQRRADDYCPRGLEKMQSSESILRSKAAKERVIDAVLDEQERQWEGNFDNASLLADISARQSANAVEIAILRAASDAAFARIYNPSPRDGSEETESSTRPSSSTSLLPPSTSSSSDDDSTSSTSTTSCSMQRTIVQNTLAKVLSSPDLTSISSNIAIMQEKRRHSSHTGTHKSTPSA